MTFELHTDESLRKGTRRLIREQLKDALKSIRDEEQESADERIHSVRKSFKRMRAILRLVRHEIGEKNYKANNARFREASRPLSEIRDATVLIDALEGLRGFTQKTRSPGATEGIEAARTMLVQHRRQVRVRILEEDDALEATAGAIEDALENRWDEIKGRERLFAKGVRDVYKSGRKAFKDAKEGLSVESLHDWRKEVKYLRYQLEVLSPLRPKVLSRRAADADELGELLGRDHDLAVLRCKIAEAQEPELPAMKSVTRMIDKVRNSLQKEALSKGERLYREKTSDLFNRFLRYLNRSKRKRRSATA